ncbi:hypothetical protein C8N32_10518 [Rhodovulum imhoffii]|uniref:Uncharacterized protein n=1 Tax=Rhodovulum imhoffii TaxID=365340 RepID=A0A2T5BT90_9RHOB|nr:hypothetical protein [Rhodovulum imhoffii]MBK5932980.1 hypothetical protein [Rhodovulum imhoffii]PTN02648.1 hypothetical protein C8N32_10518 [Rhodovulum imhoffii]
MIQGMLQAAARWSRRMAAVIVASLWRRLCADEVERRLARQSLATQFSVIGGVFLALFLASVLFAHAGVAGVLGFLLLVIWLIR